jgi:inhibitor of KinA
LNIKAISETHFMIYDKNEINPDVKEKISFLAMQLEELNHPGVLSVTTSYNSIMVEFDGLNFTYEQLLEDLKLNEIEKTKKSSNQSKKCIILPVVYGEQYGPDLNVVADHANITKEDVINIHTGGQYLIYAIGFLLGFPFLGGLDKKIHTPRKETPRKKIAAGSVGIANNQTGLYPKESPGGWQIIGRTPIDVFNLNRNPMILYEAGDYISFESIDEETYNKIEKEILDGTYDYNQLVGEVR